MKHSFDVNEAREYGVDAAIIIRHLRFWIIKNKADNKNQHDGRTWTYGSVKSFTEVFVYWSEAQVRQTLKKLLARKVLRKGNYNKTEYDRTTWYAFEDEKTFLSHKPPICENSQMGLRKPKNGLAENHRPIPNKSTDIRKDERKDKYPTPEILAHEKYGQAKTRCQDLPREFFAWFEREILGRWDKYSITPAILKDWHDCLWVKYKPEFVKEAVQTHRSESANWSPKFAEIVKLASTLRQKELAVLKREEYRKSKQATLARIESERKQPRVSFTDFLRRKAPKDLLYEYETNKFSRQWIDKHCPEIIEKAKSKITENPSKELLAALVSSRGP